ncbi:MAG: hypothetical protein IPP40_09300 [bacterium]|nr:hypothetical protein [bacterium]
MVRYMRTTISCALLCLFWLSVNTIYAENKPESTTSPTAIKQQISQSEKALVDLEQLVQQCGDCSEEVRIAGSLTELRGYIAFLKVRLDSIKSEITLKEQIAAAAKAAKEAEKLAAEKAAAAPVAVVAAEAAQPVTAPVETPAVAPTAQQTTLAEIENGYLELDRKMQLFKLQSQKDPVMATDQKSFESRLDDMYLTLIDIRNRLNETGPSKLAITTPGVDDVTLVASRSGTFAPHPKEAPAEVAAAPVSSTATPAQAPAKPLNLSDLNYKIEGRGFFAYRHDATKGEGQANEFEMARMNFGIRYFASDDLMLRYVTDIARESGTGKIDAQAQLAYVDWKMDKHFNLLTGLLLTNNWAQTEVTWGYRSILWSPMEAFGDYWGAWNKKYTTYLEAWAQADPTKAGLLSNQITASRSKMGAAADMAVGVSYKPVKSAFVNFQIRNGSGYKSAENDMFKNFQLMVGKSFMNNAVNVSAFTELEPYRGVDENGDSKGFVNVAWDMSASYTDVNKFTVGTSVNSKTIASTASITGTCISGFAHGFIKANKLKAIARYDVYNTGFNDAPVRPGDEAFQSNGTRMVIGLDYLAHKNFSIIPNLQVVNYEDSDLEPVKSAYVHMAFKW